MTESFQSIFTNDVKSIKKGTLDTTFVLLSCEHEMITSVIEKIKMIPIVSDVKQVDGCFTML